MVAATLRRGRGVFQFKAFSEYGCREEIENKIRVLQIAPLTLEGGPALKSREECKTKAERKEENTKT